MRSMHTTMRTALAAGMVVAALAGSAFAYNPTGDAESAARAAAALKGLQRPMTVTFAEDRLEDVIAFLEQTTGVDFDVRYMEEGGTAGLDKDAEVSLAITAETPALAVLERVLEKVSDEFDPATWQVSKYGDIVVAPRSRLNAEKKLRIYDVQDLIFSVPSFTDVPELDVSSVLNQSQGRGGGGGGGGGNIFTTTNSAPGEAETPEELVNKVIEIIETSIETEQWQSNGGDGAVIAVYQGNMLLITAPDYIHRQLEGYSF